MADCIPSLITLLPSVQEMSPIDIVPLHHANHYSQIESSIDLIPNHHIYHSGTGDDGIMSGHSGRPLIKDHSQYGRPPPHMAKQAVKVSSTTIIWPISIHILVIIM